MIFNVGFGNVADKSLHVCKEQNTIHFDKTGYHMTSVLDLRVTHQIAFEQRD